MKTILLTLFLFTFGCSAPIETTDQQQVVVTAPECVTVAPGDPIEALGCAGLSPGDTCGQIRHEYSLCSHGSVPLMSSRCTDDLVCSRELEVLVGEVNNIYSEDGTRFDACSCLVPW